MEGHFVRMTTLGLLRFRVSGRWSILFRKVRVSPALESGYFVLGSSKMTPQCAFGEDVPQILTVADFSSDSFNHQDK